MSGTYTYSGSGYLPMTPGQREPGMGLFGLSATTSPTLSAVGYEAATVLGAAAGGGLVGYVAAKTKQGVYRGAAFSSGLALIADGVTSWKATEKGKAAVLGLLGLLAAGWSVRNMMRSKRR
jgi:hypothetical protein